MNDACEGFGSNTAYQPDNPGVAATFSRPIVPVGIPAGSNRRVVSQLLAPFFQSQKCLPLSLLGSVVIEAELDNYSSCFSTDDGTYEPVWEIVQPLILCDTVQLDPALSSSYAKHLLEGKTLPISYHNFFSMQATLTDTNAFSLPSHRGFSRLSAIYVSLFRQGTNFVTDFASPYPAGTMPSRQTDQFRFQVQLGGDLKPTYQTDSIGELFYRLRMCQSIHTGTDAMSIQFTNYYFGNQFIIGLSLEKILGAEVVHTGVSTMGGQILYLNLNVQKLEANACTVHVVCHYDCVLSISSAGCELAY
jgi:hypothetical protein